MENRIMELVAMSYNVPEELVGKTLITITNHPPRAAMGIEPCGMLLSAIHEEEG